MEAGDRNEDRRFDEVPDLPRPGKGEDEERTNEIRCSSHDLSSQY